MDTLGQTSLVIGLTSFAMGFSVFSRNVRNRLFLSFAALTGLISLWALAFFLERVWPYGTFYRAHLFFNIWLAPAALLFIRILIRFKDGMSRRLRELSVLISATLTVALFLGWDSNDWVHSFILMAPTPVFVQILRLMWIDHQLAKGERRTRKPPTVGFARRNLIYIGGLLVMAWPVMDHAPGLPDVVPALGNLMLVFYLFFLSQAISRQRLLNFGAMLSRIIVMTAVALMLTGLYTVFVAWVEGSPGLFFLNSFIASFLILMLLDPLKRVVAYFTHQLLSQKQQQLEAQIQEAQRDMTGVMDLGSLFTGVLSFVEQRLQPQWAALFILRPDGTRYRRVRSVGVEPKLTAIDGARVAVVKEILAGHPLVAHAEALRKSGELPIILDQMLESEMDRTASATQQENLGALLQGLKALGCNLLIPLRAQDQVLGFVTIGVEAPPEPWGNNWGLLSTVYPFFEQAADAMRLTQVYAKSREKERLAALGEMSAGLAHEIRNPLGAIKGAAQYLDASGDRPDSRFLRAIIDETDRLNRVVTQFLDYSKPPTAEFKDCDANELCSRVVENLRPGCPPDVLLEFVRSRSTAPVHVNPEQIQQVLLNLVRNSEKAVNAKSKPGGTIRVQVETEGGEVTLHVEDNGLGIRRENLDKLFIPFFTTSPSGTGLGLPISQKIVEAHGGRFEVSSEEGRFARFSVVLPRAGEVKAP